jgi:hypothetical protein
MQRIKDSLRKQKQGTLDSDKDSPVGDCSKPEQLSPPPQITQPPEIQNIIVTPEIETCAPTVNTCKDLVPTSPCKSGRSKSFDYVAKSNATISKPRPYTKTSAIFLELPKWRMLVRKPASTSSTPSFEKDCVHCILQQEYFKQNSSPPPSTSTSVSSEGSTLDDFDNELLLTGVESNESLEDDVLTDIASLPTVTLSPAPLYESYQEEDSGQGVTVLSLEVPVIPKSGRSASVDSAYLQVPKRTDIGLGELPPVKSQRSRSVDVALPVGPDGPYIVVPTEKPTVVVTQ